MLRLRQTPQRGGPAWVCALARPGQRLQRLGPCQLLQALAARGETGQGQAVVKHRGKERRR